VKEEYDPAKPDKRPNSMHKWQRQLIRSYILFMGNSGLRPNEARQLRWRDVEYFKGTDGRPDWCYTLPLLPRPEQENASHWSMRKSISNGSNSNQHTLSPMIWSSVIGTAIPIENFGKTFKKILTETGLLKDRHGKARTIYSLRHPYAPSGFYTEVQTYNFLLKNMGTSPTQIYNHYRHITVRQKAKDLSGKLKPEMSRKGLYF
jgi:hypothetical protein